MHQLHFRLIRVDRGSNLLEVASQPEEKVPIPISMGPQRCTLNEAALPEPVTHLAEPT